MEILLAVLIILIAGIAVFLKVAFSFGGIKAFLAKELKTDRATLTAARKRAKSTAKVAAKELKNAVSKVSEAEKNYQKKITAAEAEHQHWTNPGNGKTLVRLGKVTLYEHVLSIGGKTIDLAGVFVDTKITDMSAVIVITLPNGMKMSESFDTSWKDGETKYNTSSHKDWEILESSTEKKRSFSPDQVIAFANEITNQAIRRADFLNRQPEMINITARNIDIARTDTADLDLAKSELESLQAGSQSAQEAQSAADALVAAEEAFSKAVIEKLGKAN